jgi:hypothetical protein
MKIAEDKVVDIDFIVTDEQGQVLIQQMVVNLCLC